MGAEKCEFVVIYSFFNAAPDRATLNCKRHAPPLTTPIAIHHGHADPWPQRTVEVSVLEAANTSAGTVALIRMVPKKFVHRAKIFRR